MADNTPNRVPATIDALVAPPGRTYIEIGSKLRFASDADRLAFLEYLGIGGGDVHEDTYLQPGGDDYLQPDGTSHYLVPA
jgi:hypothetical protein